jgi:hypothetical protein
MAGVNRRDCDAELSQRDGVAAMVSLSSVRETAAVRIERGFIIHLGVFLAVNSMLAAINLSRNSDRRWFLWVLGGWGLGVLIHGACVYLIPGARERMIGRTAARIERRAAS